ncbi:MAG: PP2C family protein-serine/threonine phosphatase [bacterium]
MTVQGLQVGVFLAGGLLLMLLGLVIFREDPSRQLNRITAVMLFFGGIGSLMGAIGPSLGIPAGTPGEPGAVINTTLQGIRQLSVLWEFFFPTLVLFTLAFPRESELLERHPRVAWLIYLPYILHLLLVILYLNPGWIPTPELGTGGGLLGAFLKLLGFVGLLIGTLFDVLYQIHLQLWAAVNVLYVVLAIYFLRRTQKKLENRRLRSQVTIIMAGIGTAVGLYVMVQAVPLLLPFLTPPQWLVSVLLSLALIIGSGSVAWVIIRHQFLDVQVLAKRWLIMSAAIGFLVAVFFLLYTWFVDFYQRLAGEAAGDSSAVQVIFVVIAVIAFQPLLSRMESLVDRFFIRDESDYRNVLQQSVRNIIGILDMDSLVRAVYQTLERAFLIQEAAVILTDRETGAFRFVRRGPPPLRHGKWELSAPSALEQDVEFKDASPESRRSSPSGPGKVIFRSGDPVAEALSRASGPVKFERLRSELPEPEDGRPYLEGLNPALLVPLKHRNELIGVLSIGPKLADTGFNTEELTLLSLLSGQISVALENAWLHEERLEQERIREELAVARQIQQDLLPRSLPRGESFEVSAINLPSREIGGDYYDFIVTGEGEEGEAERLLLVIADVSGKGTPAALLMASLQATLRAVREVRPGLAATAEKVNAALFRTTDTEKFVTLFMAELEVESRRLRYVNAGHNFPILTRASGEQVLLEDGGLLMGVMEDAGYEEGEVRLEPNDVLVLYTDGVNEAQDPRGEEFGEESLRTLIRERSYLGAREIRDEIYREVLAFAGSQPQYDDLTLVVLKAL